MNSFIGMAFWDDILAADVSISNIVGVKHLCFSATSLLLKSVSPPVIFQNQHARGTRTYTGFNDYALIIDLHR